ncbi:MAG: N-acetylmuramoyl-L-alanine amidase [Clostridia bacterium]
MWITRSNVDNIVKSGVFKTVFGQMEEKLIFSKKSILISVGSVLLCVTIALLMPLVVVASSPRASNIVVVDAGHGGIDNGVVTSDGLKESEINLEIAKLLKSSLESRKIGVIMTRTTKDALASGKKNDMAARKKIIVEAKPLCVVSIHTNKFSNRNRSGTQVFFDDTNFSKKFAIMMQSHINNCINKKYRDRSNFEAIGGDFFITKCIKAPSVIVESGFVSNALDCQLLRNANFKSDLASAVADVVETLIFSL